MNMLAQFSQNQKAIEIDGAVIRQDQFGRYCLNDLHKASGGERKNQPQYFLENKQTQDLIQELIDTGIPVSPIDVIRGGLEQGTYVVKQIVYAYAMWISAAFNLKVINTFDAVATGAMQPQITTPQDYLSALKALVVSEEQKQLAIQERDHAIATKAEIGSRREATAMGRLSAKVKEVEKLKTQLDSSTGFATIKKVQALTGGTYDTYELRRYSKTNRLEIQKAEDANYGSVNSYHKDAWLAVYNINLSSIGGAV
ncbi:KilA-N domain-containing protein [Acinetobacter sp. YH12063]|uniref:KilA-N domain-containing protein n=1 Tax=Acinetobacter sp. YH12063 TaxID=2601061 RepID=UPI00211F108A|nr:KilA-N domain-containing protein [Acinetobacter sp. YH12063]